jgi:outer membrane protein TolC
MAYDLVQGEMLPAASKQYETLSEGFSLGRIKYLEMLEGRRSLNSVRKQRVEALSAYHTARVELEAITGRKL